MNEKKISRAEILDLKISIKNMQRFTLCKLKRERNKNKIRAGRFGTIIFFKVKYRLANEKTLNKMTEQRKGSSWIFPLLIQKP